MPLLNVYCDESCKDAHRYLALGAVGLQSSHEAEVLGALRRVRETHGHEGEVKWTKNKRQKLAFYKSFADVFFDYSADGKIHFNSIYVDTSTFQHGKYNGGDRDLGFSKLIYQLLLHRYGRRYGADNLMHVYLDARCTPHQPDAMRPMLNADLKKRWKVDSAPFRRVTFIDSAKSDLVQLADILVGTVGATVNGHHKIDGAAEHKLALREHIIRRAKANEPTGLLTGREAERFNVWRFCFRGK